MISRLFEVLIARPGASLAAFLLLNVVIGVGALRLRIDFSPEQVFAGQDEAVEFSERHKELFRFEDSLVLVLLESTNNSSLLREDCLRWMRQFAERVRPWKMSAELRRW